MEEKRDNIRDDEDAERKRRKVSNSQPSTVAGTPATEPTGVAASSLVGGCLTSPDVAYEAAQQSLEEGRVPPASAEFADLYGTDATKVVHVDNSAFVQRAVQERKCLLIRPRRSGKSTFGRLWLEFMRGNAALFEKLSIGPSQVPAEGKYVCVHLDLSHAKPESFVQFIERHLNSSLESSQLPPISPQIDVESIIDVFAETVKKAGRKAAFFVDEYDSLVQKADRGNYELATAGTESLFVSLKGREECPYLFVTGSSRIAISGIYSGANNVVDVSYKAAWATVLGYTWQDISTLYSKQLEMLQQLHGMTLEDLKTQIERWYNGYQFSPDSDAAVYSIWAINRFLETGKFAPHLSKSGLSRRLVTGELIASELVMLVKGDYSVPVRIYDIETWRYGDGASLLSTQVALLSAGLLTFRGGVSDQPLCLSVPNEDCRTAVENVLMQFATGINVAHFGSSIMREDILGSVGILQPALRALALSAAENAAGAKGLLEYHLQHAFFALLCMLRRQSRQDPWVLHSEVRVEQGTSPRADFLLKVGLGASRYHVIEFGIHRAGNPSSTLLAKLRQARAKYLQVARNADDTFITAVFWDVDGSLVCGAGPLSAEAADALCVQLEGPSSLPPDVRVACAGGTAWL